MDFLNLLKFEFCWRLVFKILLSINLPWGYVKSHTKVFVTNSDFLNLISLLPNVVDLRYFKLLILLDQISLKYQSCKDIGIRKFCCMIKNQFLWTRSGQLFWRLLESAVLTFIGYKQTNKQTDWQTDKPNLYIDCVQLICFIYRVEKCHPYETRTQSSS